MNGMPYEHTIRERIRRQLLAATEPLTTRHLAELVDTTPPQAARGLRRLEDDGHVARQLAAGGRYSWTTSR